MEIFIGQRFSSIQLLEDFFLRYQKEKKIALVKLICHGIYDSQAVVQLKPKDSQKCNCPFAVKLTLIEGELQILPKSIFEHNAQCEFIIQDNTSNAGKKKKK